MGARLKQDESFEDAATEWIGMLHPASRETYKAAAIQCDVNYRRANADLFAALTESAALRETIAILRADASKAAEELHQMADNYNTMLDEAVRLGADLARERDRHQEAVKKLKGFSDHCDCGTCVVMREAIALLEPQPAPVATGEVIDAK